MEIFEVDVQIEIHVEIQVEMQVENVHKIPAVFLHSTEESVVVKLAVFVQLAVVELEQQNFVDFQYFEFDNVHQVWVCCRYNDFDGVAQKQH